jgi:hypothetical protein
MPMPSRLAVLVRRLTLAALLVAGGAAAGPAAAPLAAQVSDSARVGARVEPKRDTVPFFSRARRVSPRKAALRSLALPGWGQATLDRGAAGGVFFLLEATSVAMIVKTKRSLDHAKEARGDSIFLGWETDASGNAVFEEDPETGELRPKLLYATNPLEDRIPSRREQLEDWIALLVFNHLFSAADAFVAAHLSDLPRRASVRRLPDGRWSVAASVPW